MTLGFVFMSFSRNSRFSNPAPSWLVFLYSNTDVHTVASLLKLYLRELPEPVIPFSKYDEFLTCAKLLSKDDETVRNST